MNFHENEHDLMSAKLARETMERNPYVFVSCSDVVNKINEAVHELYYFWVFTGSVSKDLKEELQTLGYTVETITSINGARCTRISWE